MQVGKGSAMKYNAPYNSSRSPHNALHSPSFISFIMSVTYLVTLTLNSMCLLHYELSSKALRIGICLMGSNKSEP